MDWPLSGYMLWIGRNAFKIITMVIKVLEPYLSIHVRQKCEQVTVSRKKNRLDLLLG